MSGYRYLDLKDRKTIETMWGRGGRPVEIAQTLKVHPATIYKELQRGYTGELDKHGRPGYSHQLAQKAVQESIRRRGRRRQPDAAQ